MIADDEQEMLVRAVGSVFDQVDPPPAHVLVAARAAFGTRTMDEELLPLLDATGATAVRAESQAVGSQRWFSFADDHLEVQVVARHDRHGWVLVGQVVGEVDAVWVQTVTELVNVQVDDLGRFDAIVSTGPLRLKLDAAHGRRVRTEWVTL